MRRSLVLPSVLIAGLISVCGFAQSAGQEPATDSIDQPAADVDVEEATTDSAAGAEEVALRQQYLKLVQQKAELMNETALQGEITQNVS